MYKPIEITKDIFYVGVNDRTKESFESLWPLPKGVSYNSYIIRDEKTVLIDTVDICYSDLFMRKIRSVLGDKTIDYLVVNHMEPDHSGSIEFLVSKYPNIQIVGNKRTIEMLKGFYGITGNVIEVKDLDEMSVGEYTLQFYMTPMVHWPETMMTYVKEAKTLFSADAFGTFGTLDGGVLDKQICPERYNDEMIRYYSNIVGKFGSPVQTALKKLANVGVDALCSTHGPVWVIPENISKVFALYDRLSRYEAEEGLVIAYGSMYGHTEELAEIIATEAAENGVKSIVMHNVSKSHESNILRDTFKYKGLIIGSPTYNNKLYPAVDSLVSAIQNRNLKNRFFGYFGSFTWADATARQFEAFAGAMEFETVAEPIIMKQAMLGDVVDKARNLGRIIAEKLTSGAEVVPNNTSNC
ncbi:FprA family A-type flavoprotein [Proteiniphilum sp.]|uniref:FprA family A-type flavoprotein n=1 Tax=Proteiniphilum sp. TaxID=1926877 RepID=UPI002B21C54E|nr:FprA family A-type flavoprotein [Proteiniphilum sp.]MEA4917960.1 FprA family A-type flavoprotein [Proteiniphilum sp.]